MISLPIDVIGMVAEDMSPVVTYEYDAWGKLLNVSGEKKDTVGKLNPFRYRGYVYEEESGLYYVSSRYYDPEVGRFLNADGDISGIGETIQGYNLFAYCFNNPVNMDDIIGQWPKWIGKAIAVVATAVVVVAAVAITVSTFGAGSLVGVAAITAAASMAAKATEVAGLQLKKSIHSSNSTKKKVGGNHNSNSRNNSNNNGKGGASKRNGQVAVDVVEALFDNGRRIIGITPYTKVLSISTNHVLNQQVCKIFGETISLKSTLRSTGGKVIPYAFAAYAWCTTTISIFSTDPVQRAEKRGYTLK